MRIPLFQVGDIVETKSNGKRKIIGINTFTSKNKTSIRYELSGFENMLFYEEDLKFIQEEIII